MTVLPYFVAHMPNGFSPHIGQMIINFFDSLEVREVYFVDDIACGLELMELKKAHEQKEQKVTTVGNDTPLELEDVVKQEPITEAVDLGDVKPVARLEPLSSYDGSEARAALLPSTSGTEDTVEDSIRSVLEANRSQAQGKSDEVPVYVKYKCTVCSNRFTQARCLPHSITHMGQDRYRCCDCLFSAKGYKIYNHADARKHTFQDRLFTDDSFTADFREWFARCFPTAPLTVRDTIPRQYTVVSGGEKEGTEKVLEVSANNRKEVSENRDAANTSPSHGRKRVKLEEATPEEEDL